MKDEPKIGGNANVQGSSGDALADWTRRRINRTVGFMNMPSLENFFAGLKTPLLMVDPVFVERYRPSAIFQKSVESWVTGDLGYERTEILPGTRERFSLEANTELDLQAHLAGMETRSECVIKSAVMNMEIKILRYLHKRLGEDAYMFTTPEQVNVLSKLATTRMPYGMD